jgi:hypothetical protein
VADAIVGACDRLIAGEMCDQFVTDFIQGGAGTSTNMNANEVIANLALESLGHKKGEYQFVSPNDHVNYGQSTNDIYPTAFRLALILRLASYMDALRRLQDAFYAKAKEFGRVLKMGRTHLQDAVPMSLGQEFHGWATTIGEEVSRIAEVRQLLHEINLGATAIGTSVTAAPGYPELVTRYLSELTDIKIILAGDLVEATSDTGAYVQLSGVLKRTVGQADQDLQRHPLARLGPALRLQRDQPAADAAGVVDHAGQGQSGDPGSREPDQLPGDRARPDGYARRLGGAVAAQRDGAGDHLRAVHVDFHDGERGQQPACQLRQGITANVERAPRHGPQLARHRHRPEADAGLQAVCRDRPRRLRDRQVAARDRGQGAQAADAGKVGRDVFVREPDQSEVRSAASGFLRDRRGAHTETLEKIS